MFKMSHIYLKLKNKVLYIFETRGGRRAGDLAETEGGGAGSTAAADGEPGLLEAGEVGGAMARLTAVRPAAAASSSRSNTV